MHTFFALVLTVAASLVIARPPGPMSTTTSQQDAESTPTRKYLEEYLLPRLMWPHYLALDETPQEIQEPRLPVPSATEWLNKEIERLARMQMTFKPRNPSHSHRWPEPYNMRGQPRYDNQLSPVSNLMSEEALLPRNREFNKIKQYTPVIRPMSAEDKKIQFALTPRDEGYFEQTEKENPPVNVTSEEVHVGESERIPKEDQPRPEMVPESPRQTRQNPNLRHHSQKSLVAENLDELRRGFGHTHEDLRSRDGSNQISVLDNDTDDSGGTFYSVALISAIGAAAVLAALGFGIGWYTLSKRAKAAAEVDYPAYGVTGPTVDASGDRKLAHSAQMYHYQHQKQQIIAMERSGMEQRSESFSEPESDDENEEGDYTVYECPGFATTGDMEVKNPLFEEPTPATPGKCEVVKPQPKD